MKATGKLLTLGLIAMISLSACQQKQNQSQMNAQTAQPPASASPPLNGHTHINDAGVIPSIGSQKVQSTNEHGGTSHGLGSSVYSTIGSSGLHSDGLSSHLESRLSGAGISDVKVLAIDDIVILAAESRRPTSSQYDPVQQKVLSNTGGMSGKTTAEPGKSAGTTGSGGAGDDNLDIAEQQIRQYLGTNVKVFKVTGAQAVETINRIHTNGGQAAASPQVVTDDIGTLLNLIGNANK